MWLGFVLLILLSGSGWILDEGWTSPIHGLARSALHQGVVAVLFLAVAGVRRADGVGVDGWGRIAGWGAALIAVPQVVMAGAGGWISGFTAVLVFTLVPAIVVIFEAQQEGFEDGESPLGKLGPAIAGVGGAALILPFAVPASGAGWLWLAGLVASAVLSGVAAVRLRGLVRRGAEAKAAGVVCAACAVLCGMGAVVWRSPVTRAGLGDWSIELAVCLLVDGPVLFLLLWLVREMRPVPFAARYLLIPAATVAEGFVLLRPEFNWTLGLGLALLVGGGALLVRRTENLI